MISQLMGERSLLVPTWDIQRDLKAFGSRISLNPVEQACLYPWCSLKIAVSISSKFCFLKEFSHVCSSQLVANQKAFPSRLPNNSHSVSDGLWDVSPGEAEVSPAHIQPSLTPFL